MFSPSMASRTVRSCWRTASKVAQHHQNHVMPQEHANLVRVLCRLQSNSTAQAASTAALRNNNNNNNKNKKKKEADVQTRSSSTHHNHHTKKSTTTSSNSTTNHQNQQRMSFRTANPTTPQPDLEPAGSRAFAESELAAVADLYYKYAKNVHTHDECGGRDQEGSYLCLQGVKELLASIGERPDEETLKELFRAADLNDDGKLHLHEFLFAADKVLGGAPARIVLIVGGPGSGKGILSTRLASECGVVHISCGDLLRDEVARDTPLGREVAEIMARGELVSSATITALLRRRMRAFPGRRVLLDGFPRSLQNAVDFAELCGTPELALNLYCDDTILMERILKRAKENHNNGSSGRVDDNIETALKRLRTFHKAHRPTMNWLRENHVPVINLDCAGSPESVWEQLLAIGRLMRPAAQIRERDVYEAKKSKALKNPHQVASTGVHAEEGRVMLEPLLPLESFDRVTTA